MRVFISYTNADAEFASNLTKELIANNIYIWKDDYQVQRGARLTTEIIKGIEKCTNMIIILSKDYVEKLSQSDSYCKIEYEKAIEMQHKDDNFIIPLVLEDCMISDIVIDRLYVDFRNSYREGMSHLNEVLFKYLKNSSRIENSAYIRDWSKNWGIERLEGYSGFIERFVLNIDSISIEAGESYSILAQFKIVGDEQFTNIFKKSLKEKKDSTLITSIINKLYEELEPSSKKACIKLDTDGFKEIIST